MMCRYYSSLLVSIFLAVLPDSVLAADGRLEINQACVAGGCFAGDGAGFPVEITVPGSYVFTSDIHSNKPGESGINIQTDDVSLALNGFTLSGADAADGIGVILEGNRIEIRDGRIHDFNIGVWVSDESLHGQYSRAVSLTVDSVNTTGIRLSHYSLVQDCIISGGGPGIEVGNHSRAVGNQVILSGPSTLQHGIWVKGFGTVQDNSVRDAPGYGIRGGSLIESNDVSYSGLSGVYVFSGTLLTENTVRFNQEYGIEINGFQNFIHHNLVSDNNQAGESFTEIQACATCTIVDNHVP